MPFSEGDGGFGGGPADIMVVMERLGRGLVVEPYLANVVLAGGVLSRAANAAQKEAWLHPMIAGELHATLAFAEPQSRFDVANIATTAMPDGNGWKLSGNKTYVLNAASSDLIVIPARTSGSGSDASGISLFAVAANSAGLTVRSYATIDGMQAADLTLDGVAVDNDALLGELGGGYSALQATVLDATLAVCAEAVGIMDVLTEKTIEYAKSRVQFGVPISSFQALQHRMVEMYTACQQSRSLLMWSVMTAAAGGDDAEQAVSSIKYQIGVAGRKLGEEAVQIHGGMGVTWELDVAHYFKRLTAIGTVFGNADWHLDRLSE